MRTHEHYQELMSTHEYGARVPQVLLSALEPNSWVLKALWYLAHECSRLIMASLCCLCMLMSAYDRY